MSLHASASCRAPRQTLYAPIVETRPANWALRSEEWQHLSELLRRRNLSWSKVVFQRAASLAVPAEPGIYMVCTIPVATLGGAGAPSLRNVLYVGMSDSSIRERFKSHLSIAATAPMKAARRVFGGQLEFYFTLLDEPGEYEKCIYDAFGPVVNTKSPPGLRARLRPTPSH